MYMMITTKKLIGVVGGLAFMAVPLVAANAQAVAASSLTGTVAPAACLNFPGNLFQGKRDSNDITQLQQFLSAHNYLNVSATGYFGPLTFRAVQAFQSANSIPSTGFVGALTRAAIQRLSCGSGTIGQTGTAKIYSMTPTSGPTGTTVTITGFGFSSENTIHFGSGVISNIPISSSIAIACTTNPSCHGGINQTLVFTVPSTLGPACLNSIPTCMIASLPTQPGNYQVSVQSDNGTSNAMTFTVTSGTSTASTTPNIYGLNPTSGAVGTSVTIEGSGFSTTGNVIHFGGGAIGNVTAQPAIFNCPMMQVGSTQNCAPFAQTLTFTVPSSVGPYCAPGMACPQYMMLVTPNTYNVYVTDDNGTSNTEQFTVTGTSTLPL